jgi:hypothetical protein
MSDEGRPVKPAGPVEPGGAAGPVGPRPLIERIGMAAIALVLAALFGAVAVAAWFGGEIFLAAMGAIGCLMTLWVGALTLFRR